MHCQSGLAAAIIVTTSSFAVQAQAQERSSINESGITDIVVTAQKREENLQDTPISMVALGSEALERQGINSLGDLFTSAVPAMRIAPFAGRPSAVTIGMRGLVPADATQVSRDPTVGVYVDGVYLGRVSGLGLEIADIERIEILRGPQGTLFGRNSLGGAISVVSKKPSGELGVDLKVGVGNFDQRSATAHINLPEFHGLSLKFDGLWEKRDGFVRNPLQQAPDYAEVDKLGARVSALWKPTDNFSLLYAWDYSRDEPTSNYYYIFGSGASSANQPTFVTFDTDRVTTARIGLPLAKNPQKAHGHSITGDWELSDNLLIRSITAWRSLNSIQNDQDNGTGTAWGPGRRFARFSFANVRQHQFSQEVQLVGDLAEIKYVLGAFYFNEHGRDTATTYSVGTLNSTVSDIIFFPEPSPDSGVGRVPDRSSVVHARSKALFGQLTWSPQAVEGIHATVGARYTDDFKSGRLTAIAGTDPRLDFVFNSSRVDPIAILAYDFSRDINTYIKWSRAYRAGGAHSRSATFDPFNEEVLVAWELGLKADLFDRRMRLNVAAYTSKLSDQQVDFANPLNPSNTETLNAPEKRHIKGVELDLTLAPVRGLTLSASYVYTDAPPTPVLNPFSNRIERVYSAFTTKHAGSFAFDYAFPRFSIGQLHLHLDASTVGNVPMILNEERRTDSDFLVNGRISLGDINLFGSRTEFSLWGKNIFNKTYRMVELDMRSIGRQDFGIYNDPRTYGLEARVRF